METTTSTSVSPAGQLTQKIADYKAAYIIMKRLEKYGTGNLARICYGKELTRLEELQKNWNMGFISVEELQRQI